MKKPSIVQTNFSIDGETFENFMVLTFMENGKESQSIVLKFPDWWLYYDEQYQYYLFSQN